MTNKTTDAKRSISAEVAAHPERYEGNKEAFRPQGALQAAIESLGAVEVAPGHYAWHDNFAGCHTTPGCWFAAPASSLLDIGANGYENANDEDWATMPAWWTPDARFAWRVEGIHEGESRVSGPFVDYDHANYDADGYDEGATLIRITADFATGEEVPA